MSEKNRIREPTAELANVGCDENSLFSGVDDDALVGITNDVDGASALMAGVGNPPRSKVKGRKKEKKAQKRDECRIKEKKQVQSLQEDRS